MHSKDGAPVLQEMAFAAACLLVEYFQSDLELPVFPDDKAFKQFEKDEFGGEVGF